MAETPNLEESDLSSATLDGRRPSPTNALRDSTGAPISSYKHWYKIMLADGSELGFTTTTLTRLNCGPRPSGQGAIFRYIHPTVPASREAFWQEGELAYLKAFASTTSGATLLYYLRLSQVEPATLAFYKESSSTDGLEAYVGTGDRVLLLARKHIPNHDPPTVIIGLRVQNAPSPQNGLEIQAVPVKWLVPLDCQFVPCGPVDNDWEF